MRPINEFPYEELTNSRPGQEQILLLQMKSHIGKRFAIGYYDAVNDVFCIWYSPFMHTKDYRYEERSVSGRIYNNHYCIMPRKFEHRVGPRRLLYFLPMEDVLADMEDRGLFREDMDKILSDSKCGCPYLLCTVDNRVIISEIGNFVTDGKQFTACCPSCINGNIYHAHSVLSKDEIRYAVDLHEWRTKENG